MNLKTLFQGKYSLLDKQQLNKLITNGIKSGDVQPLPTTVYTDEKNLEDAFKWVALGLISGVVVVVVVVVNDVFLVYNVIFDFRLAWRWVSITSVKSCWKFATKNQRRSLFRRRKKFSRYRKHSWTQIKHLSWSVRATESNFSTPTVFDVISCDVSGGLGGFGLSLSNFLVTRGAKKLVLVSRKGVRSGFQSLFLRRWKEKNVQVLNVEYDTTKPEGAEVLLKEANKLGPVGGVFQLAAVIMIFIKKKISNISRVTRLRPRVFVFSRFACCLWPGRKPRRTLDVCDAYSLIPASILGIKLSNTTYLPN